MAKGPRIQAPLRTVPDIVRLFKSEAETVRLFKNGLTERRVRYVIKTRKIAHIGTLGAYFLYDDPAIDAIREALKDTWSRRHKADRPKLGLGPKGEKLTRAKK